MDTSRSKSSNNGKSDHDRLDGLLSDDALQLDLISALAGDRPLSKAETIILENRKNSQGNKFYSDLLYTITHQHFEADIAKILWQEIVHHKYEMSSALKRDIRLVVAALDYLSNITSNVESMTLISEDHIAHIVDVSLRDGLTGLFNHAFFYRRIDYELKIFARYGTPISLMMIDIDDFKSFNDLYGHQKGDEVLTAVGAIIEAETRDADICCRYGGEEFAVILPQTTSQDAALFGERLRKTIEKSHKNNNFITVSIGIASANEYISVQTLVKEADDALYEAKTSGKNRVITKKNSI